MNRRFELITLINTDAEGEISALICVIYLHLRFELLLGSLLHLRPQPNLTPFGAILADVDFRTSFEELGPEVIIGRTFPHLVKVFLLNIAEPVGNVFVETTWSYQPIPGDDAAVPEFPTMVLQFVLLAIGTVCLFIVAGVLLVGRHQGVPVLIIVELSGFKFHLIDSNFVGEADDILHLVLVGFYDQELKNKVGRGAVQFFFPLHQIAGALEYGFQFTCFSVLFINFLCCPINRDDEAVESAFDRPFGIGIIEEVAIGGGNGVNAPVGGILDHVQKIRIDVWLTLEVKDEVKQLIGNVVHCPGKEVGFQVASRPGKLAETTGAFGATKVTGSRWLKRHGKGLPPYYWSLQPPGGIVASRHLYGVDDAAWCQLPEEVQGVFRV